MRLFFALLLAVASSLSAQNLAEGPLETSGQKVAMHELNNDAIIRMTKAGLDDGLILQTIRTQPGHFNTSPDDLIALKQAGVSQLVIAAMVAQASNLQTREATPAPVNVGPVSPVVDDIGVYYKMARGSSDWEPMPLELVNYRDGGAAKSIFTNGIIKKDKNGRVNGPAAKLILKPGDSVLLYAPDGTQAEEYILIRFRVKSDRREFRTETGNVFHTETGADRDAVAFTARRIAKHMYQFELPEDLKPGEYGVLPPGGANPRGMANAGKMYTFSVSK